MNSNEEWKKPYIEFIEHTLMGALVFVVFTTVVTIIDFAITQLELWGISPHVISILHEIDYGLTRLDEGLFFFLVIVSSIKFIFALFKGLLKQIL